MTVSSRMSSIHLHDPRAHHLPAAEGQELAGEVGGALRGRCDLLERFDGVVIVAGEGELQAGVTLG